MNPRKPNPPATLPYQGMGASKPLSSQERGLERGFYEFTNNFLAENAPYWTYQWIIDIRREFLCSKLPLLIIN